MANHRYHGLETGIAMVFNAYGPSMGPIDGGVVSSFIVQALIGKPLTVYGDGIQTRSFCYISDMVDGIPKLLFAEPTNTKGEPEMMENSIHSPVSLGNPYELSVIEITKIVLNLTESKSAIEFKPLPVDAPAFENRILIKPEPFSTGNRKLGLRKACL